MAAAVEVVRAVRRADGRCATAAVSVPSASVRSVDLFTTVSLLMFQTMPALLLSTQVACTGPGTGEITPQPESPPAEAAPAEATPAEAAPPVEPPSASPAPSAAETGAYPEQIITLMREGRVIAAGSPKDTITDDNLHAVFATRLSVSQKPTDDTPFVLPHSAV